MHGTVLEQVYADNADFIAKVNRIVIESGLRLAYPSPICFLAEDLHNSINHTLPELIAVYTDRIHRLLVPLLR